MAIVGLALYGSRARQDDDQGADVDLLAVTDDPGPATTLHNKLTISCYPFDHVIRHAQAGDLFALHIVSEGKVIYEAWPVFEEIARAFKYRHNYAREIRLASDLGWFLTRHRDRFSDETLFNQKMAWCTRTILIARAADQRRPIFSATRLAEFAGSGEVLALIKSKTNPRIDQELAGRFEDFLEAFGARKPLVPETVHEQKSLFERDRNLAGLGVIRALMKERRHG